jgi:hypothetical protein
MQELLHMGDENGWEKAKELILYRLDELATQNSRIEDLVQSLVERSATKDEVGELRSELHEHQLQYAKDIASLQVKAGWWGAIAGVIPVALTLAIAAIAYFVG